MTKEKIIEMTLISMFVVKSTTEVKSVEYITVFRKDMKKILTTFAREIEENLMGDAGIVHGKAADKLLEQVYNPKPMSKKQKKFLDECGESKCQKKK